MPGYARQRQWVAIKKILDHLNDKATAQNQKWPESRKPPQAALFDATLRKNNIRGDPRLRRQDFVTTVRRTVVQFTGT